MRTKDPANEQLQRERLLRSAWKLFREKGYVNTTMEDILREANCSKGRFYYYFHSKAELLDYLHTIFDEKYVESYRELSTSLSAAEKLIGVGTYMFRFMDEEIGCELLSQLFIAQLNRTAGVMFWADDLAYPRLVTELAEDGIRKGELRSDFSAQEIADAILGVARSILFSWCLRNGDFRLSEAGPASLSVFLHSFLP